MSLSTGAMSKGCDLRTAGLGSTEGGVFLQFFGQYVALAASRPMVIALHGRVRSSLHFYVRGLEDVQRPVEELL